MARYYYLVAWSPNLNCPSQFEATVWWSTYVDASHLHTLSFSSVQLNLSFEFVI